MGVIFFVEVVFFLGKTIIGIATSSVTVEASPVGSWLLFPLESRYSPNRELQQVDGVIILIGALELM